MKATYDGLSLVEDTTIEAGFDRSERAGRGHQGKKVRQETTRLQKKKKKKTYTNVLIESNQ